MSEYLTGTKNGMWRGGRTITQHGYILIRVGKNHPLADVRGYAYEHRLVASEKLGRWIRNDEIVHHKDGDRRNNASDNIEVVNGNSNHLFLHRKTNKNRRLPDEENLLISCECGCGRVFRKYDHINRPRRFVSGHNMKVRDRWLNLP